MSGGVLILGAGGQVGRATAAVLRRQGRAVTGLTRGDLDITDESALDEVFRRVFGVSAFGTDLGLRIMEGLGLVAVT